MSRGWKIALSLAAAVAALNLLLAGLRAISGGTPGGPTSSSYATGPDGDAAYASLLLKAGHHVVRLRISPADAALRSTDTAVILDPPSVERSDADALDAFVLDGGRLVGAGSWTKAPLPTPTLGDNGSTRSEPFAPIAELAGVRSVESAGGSRWADVGRALPSLGDDAGPLLAVASEGAGRVLLLSDSSPLQNRLLDQADNARFALGLAGSAERRVVFFETYHGYGRGSGLGAIPSRWRTALLLEAAAVLTFMLARARRLGPPEAESRALAPPRVEYVRSLAATLRRTRDRRAALDPLRAELRRRILVRTGLPGDADDAALRSAAPRLGLAPEDLDAALGDDELALGRLFARTGDGRRQRWRS